MEYYKEGGQREDCEKIKGLRSPLGDCTAANLHS